MNAISTGGTAVNSPAMKRSQRPLCLDSRLVQERLRHLWPDPIATRRPFVPWQVGAQFRRSGIASVVVCILAYRVEHERTIRVQPVTQRLAVHEITWQSLQVFRDQRS